MCMSLTVTKGVLKKMCAHYSQFSTLIYDCACLIGSNFGSISISGYVPVVGVLFLYFFLCMSAGLYLKNICDRYLLGF